MNTEQQIVVSSIEPVTEPVGAIEPKSLTPRVTARVMRSVDVSRGQNRGAVLVVHQCTEASPVLVQVRLLVPQIEGATGGPDDLVGVRDIDRDRLYAALTEAQADQERFEARKREVNGLDTAPLTGKLKFTEQTKEKMKGPRATKVETKSDVVDPDLITLSKADLARITEETAVRILQRRGYHIDTP